MLCIMALEGRSPLPKKYISILKALYHLDRDQRIVILRKAEATLVKCICECALNILNGNVFITDSQKSKLKRHAKILRCLADKSGTWTSKKKIILAEGIKILTLLLAPIIDYFS